MANVTFNLRDKNAEITTIYAILRYNKNQFKYSSQQSIKPSLWDFEKQRPIKKSNPEYSELKAFLDNLEHDIQNIFRKLENDKIIPLPSLLKEELDKLYNRKPESIAPNLLSFIKNYIDTVKFVYKNNKPVAISDLTLVKYKNILTVLEEFAIIFNNNTKFSCKNQQKPSNNFNIIEFNDINKEFYNEYLEFLRKKKKYSDNTCGKHIKTLKKFLNLATEQGVNENLYYKNGLFANIEEPTDKIYLTETELSRLYNLDLSNNKSYEKVRDMFLIGCYTALRYSDYSKINKDSFYTNEKGIFLKVNAHKTGKNIMLPMHPIVKTIMNKYENSLPKVLTNQKMNEYLKKIGEMADIIDNFAVTQTKEGIRRTINYKKYQLITTHTARRTGATNMYLNHIPIQSIMILTGHKTEKAFNCYLRFTDEDNANILLESEFFKPKSK